MEPQQEKQVVKITENSFTISYSDLATYQLEIKTGDKSITIVVKSLAGIPSAFYEGLFTLDELNKLNKIFRLYDEPEEVKNAIVTIITNKHCELEEKNNNIELTLFFSVIDLIQKITLRIPGIVKDNAQIISDLCSIIKTLSAKIQKTEGRLVNVESQLVNVESQLNQILEIPTIKSSLELIKKGLPFKIIRSLEEYQMICQWINPNGIPNWTLLFQASLHGDTAQAFHKLCDNISPTLTIVETTQGYRFGGYTSRSWNHVTNSYTKDDSAAFVFSLDKKKKYKNTNKDMVTYCGPSYLSIFGGGHDFIIVDQCRNKPSGCNFPHSFGKGEEPDNSYVLTGGCYNFTVKEMEVFHIQ